MQSDKPKPPVTLEDIDRKLDLYRAESRRASEKAKWDSMYYAALGLAAAALALTLAVYYGHSPSYVAVFVLASGGLFILIAGIAYVQSRRLR